MSPSPPSALSEALSRRRFGMAAWIAGAALAALLPLLLFSAGVLYRQIAAEQEQGVDAQRGRTAVAAAAIAHELSSVQAGLRALGQTDAMRRGDLRAMHATAVRVVEADPRLSAIGLVDARGRHLFVSSRPFGSDLPDSAMHPALNALFGTGQDFVSPLVTGAISHQPVVGVAVAVDAADHGRLALRAVIRLEAINQRLGEQGWPAAWTAAVLDDNRVIVARSRDAARFTGQPATETLQRGIAGGEPSFRAVTKDGTETVVTVAPVPGSRWMVVVGRPLDELNDQVRRSLATVLAAGAACMMLAGAVALLLARHIGRQLRAVVDAHAAGREGPADHVSIREVAELDAALADARRDALAQLKERSEMLDVLAHEVRQPLNNASAALQAATTTMAAGARAEAADPLVRARTVLSEVQAAIDNTLAAATLLVRAQRVARQDTDVDALIGVAIADMPPLESARVQVERLTATRTASMDASLMRLALRNLVSNALKASPPGSPVIVRVSDSDEPLALLIDVIDQGPGIDDELRPRLFDRVADVRPGRRKGLGLHIVRRVMDLHGGSVQVLASGREGTVMRLVIVQALDDD